MDIPALYRLFKKSSGITTDSRRCQAGNLFFALKGDSFNGNAFAARALEAGCSYAVVDEAAYCVPGDDRYCLVDDALAALQQLARFHRRQLNTPLLAITGTNGKTTTKELIAAVLGQRQQVLYTQGNLNNQIGVPLTLLRLGQEHQIGIIEMGASHVGDIRELVGIAEPNYGLITNVGRAHLEGFGSFEGVLRAKGELYDYLRERDRATIFLHYDDAQLRAMAHHLNQIFYGSQPNLYVNGTAGDEHAPFLTVHWKAGKNGAVHTVRTRLIGSYNLPNVLAAIAVGRFFGLEAAHICAALEAYQPQNNRSQWVTTARNSLIIDAYNANPTSMQAALASFRRLQTPLPKMVILGDMLELGEASAAEHQAVVDYLDECAFDRVKLVGACFGQTRHRFPVYPDSASLLEDLLAEPPSGKIILIKGSNGMKLSGLSEHL